MITEAGVGPFLKELYTDQSFGHYDSAVVNYNHRAIGLYSFIIPQTFSIL